MKCLLAREKGNTRESRTKTVSRAIKKHRHNKQQVSLSLSGALCAIFFSWDLHFPPQSLLKSGTGLSLGLLVSLWLESWPKAIINHWLQ